MNRAKIFITFTFLLAFAVCVSGQSIQFPNELKEFPLYGNGKLKGIELKVSTRETVKAILGDDCDFKYCEYDENWEMVFVYLFEDWAKYKTEGDFEIKLLPSPEFVGRLWAIGFSPKKDISFKNIVFSSAFEKEFGKAFHSGIDLIKYSDSDGLYYSIIYEDGKYKETIHGITYRVPDKLEQDVYILVQKQNKPFSN